MGKWPYFKEKDWKRLYSLDFSPWKAWHEIQRYYVFLFLVLLASTCDTLQQNSFWSFEGQMLTVAPLAQRWVCVMDI